jgi:hypothetical protein
LLRSRDPAGGGGEYIPIHRVIKAWATKRKHQYHMALTSWDVDVKSPLANSETRKITHILDNFVMHMILAFTFFPRDHDLEGYGFIFLHILGQPNGGVASPAEFVLDAIAPVIEDFAYVDGIVIGTAVTVTFALFGFCVDVTFVG